MAIDFNTGLVKLKPQLISVYPKFSDVTLQLYMGRTPYFETKDALGNFIGSYAIVDLRQAINGTQYEELTKKIENKKLESNSNDAVIIFDAIKPIIKAMLDSDSYASCSRILALFFMKISVSGDLNEDYRDELIDELLKALDLDLIEDNLNILPAIKKAIADLQELKMVFKT